MINYDFGDEEYIWYPISEISFIETNVMEMLTDCEDDYETLLKVENKSATLGDNDLLLIGMTCVEQGKAIRHHIKQVDIWRQNADNNKYQKSLNKLENELKALNELNDKVFTLANKLSNDQISQLFKQLQRPEVQSTIHALANEIRKGENH